MQQDILINWSPQETRVAVVESGAVQELHVERALERGLVGNIYLGKVARVLPGMQSAFIDIGLERAAFLHVADLWQKPVNGDGLPANRTGAPVIVEQNPVQRALFGSIEYQADEDTLVTDFSRIRAGSLLKAHGGFLMLHLRDLLTDEPVWERLRRYLRSGRVQIEEASAALMPMAAVSLEPEAVDAEVKIVLVGSVEQYYAVQEADPDFARHFRCKVDFAESFFATEDTRADTAVFVAHVCRRQGLPQFTAAAVARRAAR